MPRGKPEQKGICAARACGKVARPGSDKTGAVKENDELEHERRSANNPDKGFDKPFDGRNFAH